MRCCWLWGALLVGCAEPPLVVDEGAVPDAPGLALECMSAAVTAGRAMLIGLDGAASGARVRVTDADGALLAEAAVEAGGRLAVELPSRVGDVIAVAAEAAPEVRWPLRVRDAEAARAALARAPLAGGAGSNPNDLVALPDGRLVLVRSGDDAIAVIDPRDGASVGIRLPEGDRPAVPWFVAPIDAHQVAVTAQGRHRVYVVDVDRAQVVRELAPPAPAPLATPFALARPYDVDGDGTPEQSVDRLHARAPQGVAVSGDRLVVAFSGFVAASPDQAPVFVPGVVASWALGDLAAPPVVARTPALDPQEVRAVGDGTVLVTSSGAIRLGDGGRVTTSSGAVWRVDAATLAPRGEWPLGDFAPTTAVIAGDALWVASLAQARVRALPLEGGAPRVELALNADPVDSVFRWVELPCGLLGAPSFDSDRLHVVDPRARVLDPAPLGGPIALGPGRPIFDGLQVVARRPGRPGVDFVGPELFALASVASRITPVELRRIWGP